MHSNTDVGNARLYQTLHTFPSLDITLYISVSSFLKQPNYYNLSIQLKTIDHEIKQCHALSKEQADCIRYLYRDWAYQYIKDEINLKQRSHIFMIDNEKQSPNHFMEAIDFAKRNPKDNLVLMQFGLMLLLHSKLPTTQCIPKIEALEQLLQSIEIKSKSHTQPKTTQYQSQYIVLLLSLNLILLLTIIPMTKNLYSSLRL